MLLAAGKFTQRVPVLQVLTEDESGWWECVVGGEEVRLLYVASCCLFAPSYVVIIDFALTLTLIRAGFPPILLKKYMSHHLLRRVTVTFAPLASSRTTPLPSPSPPVL